jgi:predicted glycoside hydrolase/deacetylase ChbG (UPF0249 family)
MVWKQKNFPPNTSIQESDWKIAEIEQELRAQIEMGLRNVPRITHMGGHMGFAGLDPQIGELMKKLAEEYQLNVDLHAYSPGRFSGWGNAVTADDRINILCVNLEKLTPGLYTFIDHPALDTPEMQATWHTGYENVARDRDAVTRVFTSEKVKDVIEKKNIRLVSYKDLKEFGTEPKK